MVLTFKSVDDIPSYHAIQENVLTFESVNEILTWGHLNESYETVLSCGGTRWIYLSSQNISVVLSVKKLLSNAFHRLCSLIQQYSLVFLAFPFTISKKSSKLEETYSN